MEPVNSLSNSTTGPLKPSSMANVKLKSVAHQQITRSSPQHMHTTLHTSASAPSQSCQLWILRKARSLFRQWPPWGRITNHGTRRDTSPFTQKRWNGRNPPRWCGDLRLPRAAKQTWNLVISIPKRTKPQSATPAAKPVRNLNVLPRRKHFLAFTASPLGTMKPGCTGLPAWTGEQTGQMMTTVRNHLMVSSER